MFLVSPRNRFTNRFNPIFGKTDCYASADAVIHLLKVKCLPVLLYGLNACPLNFSENKSLDVTIFRTLANIFKTFSHDVIEDSRMAFNIPVAAEFVNRQKITFFMRNSASENHLCRLFVKNAEREIILL